MPNATTELLFHGIPESPTAFILHVQSALKGKKQSNVSFWLKKNLSCKVKMSAASFYQDNHTGLSSLAI